MMSSFLRVRLSRTFIFLEARAGRRFAAEDLEVERIGPEHNAGSDSLLTQATFFKMRQLFFEDELDDDKCLNCIHGLGKAYDQVS